jgi:nucleoid-associated protein YgaU
MGTAQVGLVAVTALPASAATSGQPPADFHPPATATMTKLGESQPGPTSTPTSTSTSTMTRLGPPTSTTAVAPRGTATMTRLGSAPTAPTAPPTTSTTSTTATIAPETAPTSLAPVPIPPEAPAPAAPNDPTAGAPVMSDQETWVVHAGDTFWSIAEEALADHRGSFPPQNDVIRYWRQLIAVNQPNLAAPGNPDLLVPGQSLVLPSPR